MNIYLTLEEIFDLHHHILVLTGGAEGLRSREGLESAIAQPQATFGGQELYPTLALIASALAFSLIKNHPFVDGNKRVGYAALEIFLVMNGFEVKAGIDGLETLILSLAAGEIGREKFSNWLEAHLFPLQAELL